MYGNGKTNTTISIIFFRRRYCRFVPNQCNRCRAKRSLSGTRISRLWIKSVSSCRIATNDTLISIRMTIYRDYVTQQIGNHESARGRMPCWNIRIFKINSWGTIKPAQKAYPTTCHETSPFHARNALLVQGLQPACASPSSNGATACRFCHDARAKDSND